MDFFDNSEVIYSYTWDDAIEDGTFIRIPEEISKQFFKYPMAITSTIWSDYIEDHDVAGRLHDIVWMMKCGKMNGNTCRFRVKLGNKIVALEAVIEARGPNNPEPIITIYKTGEQ